MSRHFLTYLFLFLTISSALRGQNSPFTTGKWSKIGATKQGIYRLTGAQLSSLGFSLPISSSQLQLFGFNLPNLTDKVPSVPTMGLEELSIKVVDGGDGQINLNDYILFYNQGPVYWKYDSILNRKTHTNFSNADTVFYFLTLGQNGKRIAVQDVQSNATILKDNFTQHILFEKDSNSLLNSGKTFYGPAMGLGNGKLNTVSFNWSTQGMNVASVVKTNMHLASTSYQSNGQFDFFINDQLLHTTYLPTVSGMLFDDIASEKTDSFSTTAIASWPNKSIVKIAYNTTATNATGWIDYVELLAKKSIGLWQDSAIEFSMEDELARGVIANCKIQNVDSTTFIWNVTNVQSPKEIKWLMGPNGVGSFNQPIDSVVDFFSVKQNAFEAPSLLGSVMNQNTIQLNNGVDYIIIAAPAYLNAAIKYQQFQQSTFTRNTMVVNAKEIYNDFAGGQANAIAIRNFIKYLFNSAIQNKVNTPRYLLLMGIGNFNTRKINTAFELPTYESVNSNSILSSFSTDDFFSILNNNEDINNYNAIRQLALSVGRIPARTTAEADTMVNKLIQFQTKNVGGLWKNKITWVADDGDYNLHLQDAEFISDHLKQNESHWDHQKVYLDFYPAQSSTSGNTYPLAFNAIQQSIQDGSLLLNYTGHGNYLRLSEEAVIDQSQFAQWKNAAKLPLLVTASCNFAPYDQPNLPAIGWDALMKNGNGIIGLVAANRLVFAYSNKQINDLFIQQLLVKNGLGKYSTIGEALEKAKMINWAQGGDRINDLKFNLMGDPALQLINNNNEIKINSINSKTFTGRDTLTAGLKHTLQGAIVNRGVIQTNYNAPIEFIVYDVLKNKKTLANISTSMSVPIAVQENILFKGKATVVNGMYQLNFILPPPVSTISSPIRLELATLDSNSNAGLVIDSLFVKYNLTSNNKDTSGPQIVAFLNHPLFKSGDWAMSNSTLYLHLTDSSGIQTSGNALGHDISIWMDQDPVPIVLNNYYTADIDSYQSGKVQYALPTLAPGVHQVHIKAWDLLGNSNTASLTFEVPNTNLLVVKNPFNYPNPFVEKSRFGFEINQTGEINQVDFDVYDWAGNLLYTTTSNIMMNDNKISIDWDGKMNSGASIQPGVYFYRFRIKSKSSIVTATNTFIKL